MNAETVLNPWLYHLLACKFGPVKVAHRAEARVVRPDMLSGGDRLTVVQWGETYWVRCTLCNDPGRGLGVSHLYAQPDASGRPQTHLAVCRNDGCMRDHDNRVELAERLGVYRGLLDGAPVGPGRVGSGGAGAVELPSPLRRLDELDEDHPARRFLVRRGLNPDIVGKFYGSSFYVGEDDRVARGRIIIPVRLDGKLCGWQALSIRPTDWDGRRGGAKYLSAPGMQSSRLVYNLDRARRYHTGVVVAEPTGVWAFGPMAVCLLCDSSSDRPARLLRRAFADRTIVLLARDARRPWDDFGRLHGRLDMCPDVRLVVAQHPKDLPPGAKGRSALRRRVREAARAQGVRVSFKQCM